MRFAIILAAISIALSSPASAQRAGQLIAADPVAAAPAVAVAVTATHARRLCRSGARLRYVTINGAGHATSAKDSADTTLAWIADRFAGRRAPSDCGRL